MPQRPILIAGAGIGGLTLAIALARRGVEARVLERAPALDEVGAGIQLSPNASRALDELGLGPALDAAGIRPEAIRLVSGRNGRDLARVPLGTAAERRWGAPYRLIHRAALQRILADAAKDAGAEMRLGAELIDFTADEDGVAAVLGGASGEERVAGAALIGADGVRSRVRTAMGAGALRFSGQIAWRATAPGAAGTDTLAWLGPGAHLVTYPLDRNGTTNLVALTHGRAAEGWSEPGDRAELVRAFTGWTPEARRLVTAAEAWVKWPLYDGAAVRGRGPVTLIGDAAHPVLPHAAQGAAMAIEDAAVLAARIAEMPNAPADAFRAYEEARAARTARVQEEARRNGTVFRLGGPAAFMRDAALRMIGPERQMARLDWIYGYGKSGPSS